MVRRFNGSASRWLGGSAFVGPKKRFEVLKILDIRMSVWYVYDVSPRTQRRPILSGSARAVADYAAGRASPMHRGDGFIYSPPQAPVVWACGRLVCRQFSRVTPAAGGGGTIPSNGDVAQPLLGIHFGVRGPATPFLSSPVRIL